MLILDLLPKINILSTRNFTKIKNHFCGKFGTSKLFYIIEVAILKLKS